MTNILSLEDIRYEARRKYQPVLIGLGEDLTVELKPALRLAQKEREAVLAAIKEVRDLGDISEDDQDDDEVVDEYAGMACDLIAKALKLICTSPRRLLSELDKESDPRIRAEMYTDVLRAWMGGTQLGEAESSPA